MSVSEISENFEHRLPLIEVVQLEDRQKSFSTDPEKLNKLPLAQVYTMANQPVIIENDPISGSFRYSSSYTSEDIVLQVLVSIIMMNPFFYCHSHFYYIRTLHTKRTTLKLASSVSVT